MTFNRSASGLRNQAKFHGVDVVVFVEGSDDPQAHQFDAKFWRRILSAFGFTKSFHVSQRGSKTGLIEIAAEADNLNIKSVCVCVDTDFDVYTNRHPNVDCIISTYGRTFESDLLTLGVFQQACETWLPGAPTYAQITAWFECHVINELKKLSKFCRAELVGHICEMSPWTSSGSCGGMAFWQSGELTVADDKIRTFLRKIRAAHPGKIGPLVQRDNTTLRLVNKRFSRSCLGQVLQIVTRSIGNKSPCPPTEFMINYSISALRFDNDHFWDRSIFSHYQNEVNRLSAWVS
jgi:hypothetical protein